MNTKLLVFDLDGTLIDSLQDLAMAVNFALRAVECPERTLDEIQRAIGHGALRLIVSCLPVNASIDLQERAFEIFLTYYNEHCAVHTKPYHQVQETLEFFFRSGLEMALLTNKPFEPTIRILESLGLSHYFAEVLGGDSLPVRKPESAGLWYLMGAFGVLPNETWMIGDSSPDFACAASAGVSSVGFESDLAIPSTWQPRPKHIIQNFSELISLIS